MKIIITLIFAIVHIGVAFCQNDNEKLAELNRLFELGTKQLQNGQFRKADSTLTLSIDIQLRYHNIFNRALARINLQDTCGFCNDLGIAMLFNDEVSNKLFL